MAEETTDSPNTNRFSLKNLYYRNVTPTDLPKIVSMEQSSYPPDESASKSKLQYRQHHAAPYFRAAIFLSELENDGDSSLSNDALIPPTSTAPVPDATITTSTAANSSNDNDDFSRRKLINSNSLNGLGELIGYITATRCHSFTEQSMSIHDPNGSMLAIHSVVVSPKFRNRGVGTAMLRNYMETLSKMKLKAGITKIILMSKAENLTFYIKVGFKVTKKSPIVHGKEPWYECEYDLRQNGSNERKLPCWIVDSFALIPLSNKSSSKGSKRRAQAQPDNSTGSGGSDHSSSSNISSSKGGSGNPAAVVLLPKIIQKGGLFDPEDDANISWMKTVANEFQLSETAFIWEHNPLLDESAADTSEERYKSLDERDTSAHYCIRFYTRDGSEVALCGHATLAASSIVFQQLLSGGRKGDMSVTFHTKDNILLRAKPSSNSMLSTSTNMYRKIVMDFPWKEVVPVTKASKDWSEVAALIRDAFFPSKDCDEVEQNYVEYIGVDDGGDDLFVELTAEAFASVPRNIRDIDLKAMMNWDGYKRGVIVCCEAGNGIEPELVKFQNLHSIDFMSRFFGPKVGIEEDPVTGSAHCILAPYFGNKLEKDNVVGFQMSQRGGIVDCTLKMTVINGVAPRKAISICGIALTTMSGSLHI